MRYQGKSPQGLLLHSSVDKQQAEERAAFFLRKKRPIVSMLPTIICAAGAALGAFTGAYVNSVFFDRRVDWPWVTLCLGGVGLGGWFGGSIGRLLVRYFSRPYLRKTIEQLERELRNPSV
jgi:hypothetical protein